MNYFNYFTEVEEAFIRRRGKPLLLSPADWALIESWKERGIPLHIVLSGIERAFDSHAASRRRRSVKSLFYCQEEVEAQYAEWLESRVGAGQGDGTGGHDAGGAGDSGLPFPRAAILDHLAHARAALWQLRREREKQGADELSEALDRAIARLEELERDFAAAARPSAEQLETSLTQIEALLDRALRASLTPTEIAKARAAAVEQLQPYAGRMQAEIYEQTLENLLAKSLRERSGVPRLSLYYL